MKYIFVTGGVVSSLGKGITASSLGRLLKARGYRVSMQKCDPYYNVYPGLLSPLQHGEAFITRDGVAADLDLGHYERFTGEELTGEASVTTGKVHRRIMEKELRGDYHGGSIQVVPNVTDEIKVCIRSAASHSGADIAIIEIGGVVGDIEASPFLEAIRQMKWEEGPQDVCFIHVTLLPFISAAGEQKTKPTQHSVKLLRSIGIQPDVIVCRTEIPITTEAKDKIGLFCNVKTGNVVQNNDAPSLFAVPLMLEKEGLADIVCRELDLHPERVDLSDWEALVHRYENPERTVRIGLVGKYVELHDAYISVAEALAHAGIATGAKIDLRWIDSAAITPENVAETLAGLDGVVLPGGYGVSGAEGIITAASYARKAGLPCLAIGYGMQLSVAAAARDLLGLARANSTEVDPETPSPVVSLPADRADLNDGRQKARMGSLKVRLCEGVAADAYGASEICERHGNRYEVDAATAQALSEKGFRFTGVSEDGWPEVFEYAASPFCLGVIYHPEFRSRPDQAHPLFVALVKAASAGK